MLWILGVSPTLYWIMYNKILNQCNGNPLTTAVLKHFQGNHFTHKTRPSTPNLSADLPACVIKSHFKPNSNLDKIFFIHPVFSGIICWFPLHLQWRMNQAIPILQATPPCDIRGFAAREGTEIQGSEIMLFVAFLFFLFY